MNKLLRIYSACLFVFQIMACGPVANRNQTASSQNLSSGLNRADEQDEEALAPLGLTGLGDRVCRFDYSFVKKDANGNYSVVGNGSTSDNVARGGYGRGCINFCLVTFDDLKGKNEPNGIEIFVKSCQFAATTAATAQAVQPPPVQAAQPAAVTEFQAKKDACKVVQADQAVIFAEQRTRSECSSECDKRAQTNPQRRCEWGTEVLRQHPTNQCIIRGAAGKLHYQQTVTRFQCRMECKARENTNPNRSCLWGGENIKGL